MANLNRKALKKPDKFVLKIRSVIEQIVSQPKQLVIGVIFLTLSCGIGMAYLSYTESHEAKARNALFRVQAKLFEKLESLQKPSNVKAKINVDQDLRNSVEELQEVAKEFSGTHASFEAYYQLGQLYYQNNEPAKSLDWFSKAAESASGRYEQAMTWSAIGYAHENSNEFSDAIQSFQKALDQGVKILHGDLLLGIARCFEITKNSVEAKSTYEKVLAELPDTSYAEKAEFYLLQLK